VSKLLLNLLVQISKALVNSKIQFLFRKDFFQLPSQSAQQPTGPFGLFHPLGPAGFILPPSPMPAERRLLLAHRHTALLPRHGVDLTGQAHHYPLFTWLHFLPHIHCLPPLRTPFTVIAPPIPATYASLPAL
jgi:hypothetical protein